MLISTVILKYLSITQNQSTIHSFIQLLLNHPTNQRHPSILINPLLNPACLPACLVPSRHLSTQPHPHATPIRNHSHRPSKSPQPPPLLSTIDYRLLPPNSLRKVTDPLFVLSVTSLAVSRESLGASQKRSTSLFVTAAASVVEPYPPLSLFFVRASVEQL
jgi:hypothetical protein